MEEKYPDSEVYEKAFLSGLFHNKDIQDRYLMEVMPHIFLNKTRRIVVYAMQKLRDSGMEISIDSVYMYITNGDETITAFIKKNLISKDAVTYEAIYDLIYDFTVTNPKEIIETVRGTLYDYAFTRYVTDKINEMKDLNTFDGARAKEVMAIARSIPKVYEMINRKKIISRDQLEEAKVLINSRDEYIPTCSDALNMYIGGFTRQYVAAIIAKSSHCKSTWSDFNAIYSIGAGRVGGVDIITPEETAPARWRRIIAMICGLSTSAMRQKKVEITADHIHKVKLALKGRLRIHDDVFKMSEVIDRMEAIDSDMIIVDHLQSVTYPGIGGQLSNMIQHIPTIVGHEKRIAKTKNAAIINISQVGDKEIAKSDRLMKLPRYHDAYGSSILYQASREFLSLWYPYKDYEDNLITPNGKTPTPNDVLISIEKSSFSKVGRMYLNYDPDHAFFTDVKQSALAQKKEETKKDEDTYDMFKK